MVIIAGYEKELKTCFFDYNQGLEFTFYVEISKQMIILYKELFDIFIKKVEDAGLEHGVLVTEYPIKDILV